MTSKDLCKHLNPLSSKERSDALLRCCGSSKWASLLNKQFPFSEDQELYDTATSIWGTMEREDILEAFSHHPQIGADPEALRQKFKTTHSWSSNEQAGMSSASEDCIADLAQCNKIYLERFGYIFIVCATGKTAAQMLSIIQQRLNNQEEQELKIAAAEQGKITLLRLHKLTE